MIKYPTGKDDNVHIISGQMQIHKTCVFIFGKKIMQKKCLIVIVSIHVFEEKCEKHAIYYLTKISMFTVF